MNNLDRPRTYRAIVAGFCASATAAFIFLFAHMTAKIIAAGTGSESTFGALADNNLVSLASDNLYFAALVHFGVGLTLACIYSLVEKRLPGKGWQSGIAFSMIPWLLSALVFFPMVGAGFLGLKLGAGFLPVAGSLVLHLFYGVMLGTLYGPLAKLAVVQPTSVDSRLAEKHIHEGTSKGAALGILGGTFCGLAVATSVWLLFGQEKTNLVAGLPWDYVMMALVFFCSSMGMLLGFWTGIPTSQQSNNEAQPAAA